MIGRLGRWIAGRQRRRSAKAAILMYHRVANIKPDPWDLCVSPDHFEAQLAALVRGYRVLPLVDLLTEVKSGKLHERTVAITFDDGYADNLHMAASALVRHRLPATFFVTSGAVGSNSEFWWDRLERSLLRAGPLPPALQLETDGSARTWELGTSAGDPGDLTAATRPWEADSSSRLGVFYSVWEHLRDLDETRRDAALSTIEAWSGAGTGIRPTHRTLSREELRELAGLPGMTIGAHSMTHAALSRCGPARQKAEILGSRVELERMLGRPVSLFAYPFGDFGPETPGIVREAGFEGACIADPDVVWSRTDRYHMPRLAALDLSPADFCRELDVILQ